MDINLSKYKKNIMILPLGGSGEIGLNCNLFHYDGKWLMIDCGVGFSKDVPGVTLSVPDLAFFKKNKKNFLGLFITHVHEDHIGAIPYLWEELELPIYASHFACAFIKEKLSEYEFVDRVKFHEINPGEIVDLKPFQIEPIGLTHSTPEMNALLVKTEAGNVLYSGDWRFDNSPVIGPVSDKKRLKELGDNQEVLATICESTNIFKDDENGSESDLLESFTKIISEKKGMVLITTFASNVGRIKTIIESAKKCKRKVVLVGKSLFRIADVARSVGLLPKNYEFLSDDEAKNYPKNQLVVISTGCQGEDNAGLDKIANGVHRNIKLSKDDTVIFSSKVIPGNEKSVFDLYNQLAEKDVELVTVHNGFVHVSGHYTRDDLEEMYKLVRPKIAIAVHGDEMHLSEHKRFAERLGISEVVKGKNGRLLRIENDKVHVMADIDTKPLAIDGKRLIPFSGDIIKYRKKILNCGVVFINIIMNNKFKLLSKPVIFMPGAYDLKKDIVMKEIFEEDISSIFNKTVKKINETKNKGKKDKNNESKKVSPVEAKKGEIEQMIRKTVNSIFNEDIGKKPIIEVSFTIIK